MDPLMEESDLFVSSGTFMPWTTGWKKKIENQFLELEEYSLETEGRGRKRIEKPQKIKN